MKKQLLLKIPEKLKEKAKIKSVEMGMTLTAYINKLIYDDLNN